MERTGKMILSAVFGALTGLIIAFAVNRLYWWVGLAVGGLTGYLSHDWRTVVKTAARLIHSPEKLALIGKKVVVITTLLCWAGGWAAALSYPFIYAHYSHSNGALLNMLGAAAVLIGLCVVIFTLAGLIIALIACSFDIDRGDVDWRKLMFFSSSVIAICVMVPYGIFLLAREIPNIGREAGHFTWRLFVLIHSEDRMIVGFSALLGTAGGYVAKSFIAGAAVAAASVVIAKHVVAERWLKPHGYIRAS
jgi:hypothetical protein